MTTETGSHLVASTTDVAPRVSSDDGEVSPPGHQDGVHTITIVRWTIVAVILVIVAFMVRKLWLVCKSWKESNVEEEEVCAAKRSQVATLEASADVLQILQCSSTGCCNLGLILLRRSIH